MLEVLGAIALVVLAAVLSVAMPPLWERLREKRIGAALAYSLEVYDGPLTLFPNEPPAGSTQTSVDRRQVGTTRTALGWQTVRLTLRGLSSKPVVVTKLAPVILSREEPLSGWFEAPELGGGQTARFLVADLDDPAPVFRLVVPPDWNSVTRNYAFRVTEEDVELLELEVFSSAGYIRWGLDIHYNAENGAGVISVRDDRFGVTAEGPQARPFAWHPDGRWDPAPWGAGYTAKAAARWRAMPAEGGPLS